MKKALKIFYNIIFAIIILLIVAISISFLPIPGNYELYTVQSGSMEPEINTGSLIFVKSFDDYNVGEIVTREGKETEITITHRIIEKKEVEGQALFITKGDANDGSDAGEVEEEEILGKMVFKIPLLGYLVAFVRTTQGFMLLVIIPAVIIVYSEIQKIYREIKKKIDYKKRVKKREESKSKDLEDNIKNNKIE